MTTLIVLDTTGNDINKAVSRRIREELARAGTNVNRVSKLLPDLQQKLSRRMTGKTPWAIDELYRFCAAAGISFAYVTTGIREIPGPRPDGSLPLPRMDSNHQPPDSPHETSPHAHMQRDISDAA